MNDINLCGCGKPVRYWTLTQPSKGSCNKYARCPSRDELLHAVNRYRQQLSVYQTAVNLVDDYFEYSSESKQDQRKVHQILGNLTDSLKSTLDQS